ncbi:hypothetical protein ANO11243_017370 [Dothideomycetidae sp. 11243]|nr:hypothetical protein ANO11243_017370 [fungal sp. No.11243]
MVQPSTIVAVALFPGAGNAINNFNVAFALATPAMAVHVLVADLAQAKRWMASTGQTPNPYVHLRLMANGALSERARSPSPGVLMQLCSGKEYADAIEKSIGELRREYPDAKVTALVANALMTATVQAKEKLRLRMFMLSPTPMYLGRLASGPENIPGADPDTIVRVEGIAGLNGGIDFKLEDCIDICGPMWYNMIKPAFDHFDGFIVSNTNAGLEGKQESAFANKEIVIGPLLPEWFINILDTEYRATMEARADSIIDEDGVLDFLDRQKNKSTVYVALGSHADFSIEQAQWIINALEELKVPYVFLHRENTKGLRNAVGGNTNGIITSWAPQLEVLAHPAINFAISHGGFGTMIEGIIGGGIPFITCPVASDQFMDTKVMGFVGMLLGCIGINKRRGQAERKDAYPFMHGDNGETVRGLLHDLLASPEGSRRIEAARSASLDLRRKILRVKETEVPKALEHLRSVMAQTYS